MKSLILALSILTAPFASHAKGGEGVGGGAGCDLHDGFNTLYYCGAYHETAPPVAPAPADPMSNDGPSEVPADLADLRNIILKFPYFSKETRNGLIAALTPSFTRKYFSTDAPPSLTAPEIARIKAEFQRATGLDPSHLTLYAVTDTNARMDNYRSPIQVTYLLPAFFSLASKEERMTALFHEALWVMQPTADYPTVIAQEMAFEAMLAEPTNTNRLINLVEAFGDERPGAGYSRVLMTLSMRHDLESGALRGFVDANNEITNHQLFGPLLDCPSIMSECVVTYKNYIDSLRRQYPNSLYLVYMQDMADIVDRNEGAEGIYSLADFLNTAGQGALGFGGLNCFGFSGDEAERAHECHEADEVAVLDPSSPFFSHFLWSLAEKTSDGQALTRDKRNQYPKRPTNAIIHIKIDSSDKSLMNGLFDTDLANTAPSPRRVRGR